MVSGAEIVIIKDRPLYIKNRIAAQELFQICWSRSGLPDRSLITRVSFQCAIHGQFAVRDLGRSGRWKRRRYFAFDPQFSDYRTSLASIKQREGNLDRRPRRLLR